jgi:hypothetical protein
MFATRSVTLMFPTGKIEIVVDSKYLLSPQGILYHLVQKYLQPISLGRNRPLTELADTAGQPQTRNKPTSSEALRRDMIHINCRSTWFAALA